MWRHFLFWSACVASIGAVRRKLTYGRSFARSSAGCDVRSEVEAPNGLWVGSPMQDATVAERVKDMIIVDWPDGQRHYRVHTADTVTYDDDLACGTKLHSEFGKYYIFLDRYAIVSGVAYHTHILLCSPLEFDEEVLAGLDAFSLASHASGDYTRMESRWVAARSTTMCWVLQFGQGESTDSCSGVRYRRTLLKEWDPYIPAADPNIEKDTYLYGFFHGSPDTFYRDFCAQCGKTWQEYKYDLLRRNCNIFSSTLLRCWLGLRENVSMAYLGVSRMAGTTCPCSSRA